MNTGLQTVNNTQVQVNPLSNYPKETLDCIRNTVAKGATESEFFMFMALAWQYKLDPLKKEIWFIKNTNSGKNDALIMTGVDGYITHAKNHPDFKGLKSAVVYEGDECAIDYFACEITHKVQIKKSPNKKIVGAWAIAYRDGVNPVIEWADFEEWNKPNSNSWRTNPSAMIKKCAIARALKIQFGISGLVTKEEMDGITKIIPDDDVYEIKPEPVQEAEPQIVDTELELRTILLTIVDPWYDEVNALLQEQGISQFQHSQHYRNAIIKYFEAKEIPLTDSVINGVKQRKASFLNQFIKWREEKKESAFANVD